MPADVGITVRPYQLVCSVCARGGKAASVSESVGAILAAVQDAPDLPVTLSCNVGEVFAYQDPGTADDTPEGAEFNVRRDLEILHKLNLEPGCTLPARILYHRLLDRIETVAGICGYPRVTSDAWEGCPDAGSGNYERGRALGISAFIPPRPVGELEREKAASLEAMYQASPVHVRPHILLCAVCQYGNGIRPPYAEDNLPELIQVILKKPETLILLVAGADWMMCAPCPYRVPGINGCVNQLGSGGLPNRMRDLRMLQKLGLSFGDVRPARELFRLIFERLPGTLDICRLEPAKPSVWWDGCGAPAENSESYDKGKQQLIIDLGI